MLEVEVKFPVSDLAAIEMRLKVLGATPERNRVETDYYFNAPDRDFASTDEALRLRRIGPANFVTYKGPKTDKTTKTRLEIEVALAEGDEAVEKFKRLLASLGYRPVAQVEKQRQIYSLDRGGFAIEICLDQVRDVGAFVEIETQAPDTAVEQARQAVLRLARELELETQERRSYLELLLGR
jgi:adenylate cyclase, class 2